MKRQTINMNPLVFLIIFQKYITNTKIKKNNVITKEMNPLYLKYNVC